MFVKIVLVKLVLKTTSHEILHLIYTFYLISLLKTVFLKTLSL